MALVFGDDSGLRAMGGYFNPMTGYHDGEAPYSEYYNIGTQERHWMPPGLTIKRIKKGKTGGFRKKISPYVLGVVWVETEKRKARKRARANRG